MLEFFEDQKPVLFLGYTLKIFVFPWILFNWFLPFDVNLSGEDDPVSTSGSFDPYDLVSVIIEV